MAETNENIQDLVEQITCKMLLNDAEFNYLDNKDENQKAKRKKIHDEKKEEINEVIKALCSVVEKQLPPGIAAPAGLNVLIARRMLFEMKDGKNATKEFAKVDPITLLSEYNIPVRNSEYTESEIPKNGIKMLQDEVRDNTMLNDMFIGKNGVVIYFEKDVDPVLAYVNEAAKAEDREILDLTDDFNALFGETLEGTKKLEDVKTTIREKMANSVNKVGIDALMKSVITQMDKIDDPKVKLEFLRILDEERKNDKYGFREDNYTGQMELELISKVYKEVQKNPDSPEYTEMMEILSGMCGELVEIVKKDPDVTKRLEEKYGVDYHIRALGNDSNPRSLEEFIKVVRENMIERNPMDRDVDNTLPGLEEQEEIKQPEVEQERPEPERDKTQLTMAEKMENVKKNIIDIAKAKGATAALKFANNLIMNRSGEEREAITASVIEVVSRDEFIETAKEDDLGTIREIIGGCLDEDNKKQNPQLIDYVQALGGVSKDIKSRIKAQEMTVEEDTKSIGAQQPSRDDDEPEL